MASVKVRVPAWMMGEKDDGSEKFTETIIEAPNVARVMNSLEAVAGVDTPLQDILAEKAFALIINGRYANVGLGASLDLCDGDEIMLIPLLDGG